MHIFHTQKFLAMLEKLPVSVRAKCNEHQELLTLDPRDPRLHLKKLRGMDDTYSFRITRSYRVLFIWEEDSAWFFAVGDRKDIYR